MKKCNMCGQEKDTYLRGKMCVDVDGRDYVVSAIVCSGCVSEMSTNLVKKYSDGDSKPVSDNEWEAWETPAYDSD